MSQQSNDEGFLAELWSKATGAVSSECSWAVRVLEGSVNAMVLTCNEIRSLVHDGIYSSPSTAWNCP